MTTRVVEPHEIFLNGVQLPIAGKVRSQNSSTFPQKRITGDFNKDSQPHVSVQTWDDQRGGMGLDRWSAANNDRSFQTGLNIRNKGHLTLGPTVASVGTTGQTAGLLIISELGGNIVSANGTDVQDLVGATWTSRHTLAATPTDVRNGSIDGTEYLVFCYTTGYAYSSAIATWATSTVDALNIEFWDNRLWGIDASGQLWYTFSPGSNEVNDTLLNLATNEIVTGMFRGRENSGNFILYVVTNRNLYAHDFGTRRFVQVEGIILPGNNVATHERPGVVWRERIYLAAGRGIIEYDPIAATVREMGFDQDDGLDAGRDGEVISMEPTPRELYVGTAPVSGSDVALIMAWDGRGWRQAGYEASGSTRIESMHFAVSGTSSITFNQLWHSRHDGGNYRLSRQRTIDSATLTSHIDGAIYGNSGINFRHIYPKFDAGQRDVVKVALRVVVEVVDATSVVGVIVYVATDGGSLIQLDQTYTNDATFDVTDDRIEGDGFTTFSFPSVAAPAGTEFRDIQIAVEINRDSGNASSDILSVTLEYLKVLDDKDQFDFEIDCSGDYFDLTPQEIRAAYATAKASKVLVELTYRDDTGGTRNPYVKVFDGVSDEETGYDETGNILVHCEEI